MIKRSSIRLSCVSIGGLRSASKETKRGVPRKLKPTKAGNWAAVSDLFEDFKEKVREHIKIEQKPLSASLSPQVLEKLEKEGIDPDNFTLKQLWPEVSR